MIRASKRISLNANQINFNNSFAVSPIIDLNGIVLRADRSLSEQKPIQDFLSKYNAQVSRVMMQYRTLSTQSITYEYENYIRIYGTFNISQKDTNKFLVNNVDFMLNQLENLEKIDIATNMHFCIVEQYNLCKKDVTYGNLMKNTVWEVPFDGCLGGKFTNIEADSLYYKKPNLGGDLLDIKVNKLISEGRIFNESDGKQKTNFGLMTPFFSLKRIDIKFSSYAHLNNAFIQAETVNISVTSSKISENNDKNLTLSISPGIDWLNNPYHEFNAMFKIKSGVEMYELKKERFSNGREVATVIKSIPRPK